MLHPTYSHGCRQPAVLGCHLVPDLRRGARCCRMAHPRTPARPGEVPSSPVALVLAVVVKGSLAAPPVPGDGTQMVLFWPGTSTHDAFPAIAAIEGRVLWTDPSNQVWAIAAPTEMRPSFIATGPCQSATRSYPPDASTGSRFSRAVQEPTPLSPGTCVRFYPLLNLPVCKFNILGRVGLPPTDLRIRWKTVLTSTTLCRIMQLLQRLKCAPSIG